MIINQRVAGLLLLLEIEIEELFRLNISLKGIIQILQTCEYNNRELCGASEKIKNILRD